MLPRGKVRAESAPATCAGLGQGPAWGMPPSQLHGGVEGARGWGRGAQGLTLPFFLLADKTPTPQALLVQLLVSSGAAGKELFWPGAGGGAGAGLLLLFGVELPGGRSRVPGGRSEPVSLCPHLGGGGFCWVQRM